MGKYINIQVNTWIWNECGEPRGALLLHGRQQPLSQAAIQIVREITNSVSKWNIFPTTIFIPAIGINLIQSDEKSEFAAVEARIKKDQTKDLPI